MSEHISPAEQFKRLDFAIGSLECEIERDEAKQRTAAAGIEGKREALFFLRELASMNPEAAGHPASAARGAGGGK